MKLLSGLKRIFMEYIDGSGYVMLFHRDIERKKIIKKLKLIKEKTDAQIMMMEALQLYEITKNTQKIKGDIAEVGVYKGGSARIICLAKKNKSLFLFDTFRGLPDISECDKNHFKKGQYAASMQEVKKTLEGYSNIFISEGSIPESAETIKDKRFSLVHLDVDIYSSTLKSLHFFYPRTNKGGVIISHDYKTSYGAQKAFNDFFEDKPEAILETPGTQCLVVKI